ncbi:peptidase U32 family protein [Anaeromicropila herbilytica]|uniref:Peptidase U32 n=1 Tax=Anaeromicropila herbilytica TaxID=2785025 RepID=A0A7R7ICD9_9FIRM|nr:U32 family peptidase [Anaeromicropila herbilytica]BCN30502.1 peptidase U32 [Anaeromicropila herbilytica]
MIKKIEILAPAGSSESLKAAVNAGCDAVYIGGNKFGARAYANNLSEEELLEAIDYVHIHGKSLYLTVNTVLKNPELENELYEYIKKYYEQGLDAVIVQDLGVLHFIHKNFPDLPIHASTQMTLTTAEGVKAFEGMGVTRLVTSRELSSDEIQEIREHTNLEIESFVHGALCYCYSGQCYMSSMLGGRSGNRGRCAQTCRMPYRVFEKGKSVRGEEDKYILSPKDIMTLSLIPDLIGAGIDSFKIEGRMKRPEYTALVTSIYRKYVDLYLDMGRDKYLDYTKKHQKELDEDIKKLMDLYNRGGFSSGYYKTHNGKNMMSMQRPNHSGVLVGEISQVKGNRAEIILKEEVNSQDLLDIRMNEESIYEFTLKNGAMKGDKIETNFKSTAPVKKGYAVYRTKNDRLLNELKEKYLDHDVKQGICGKFIAKIGEKMELSLTHQDIEIKVKSDIVEEAKNQPTKREKIENQLNKMNTTSFYFAHLDIILDENIFIPAVKINELRREAVSALTNQILSKYRRVLSKKNNETESNDGDSIASSHTLTQSGQEKCSNNKSKIVVHLNNRIQLEEVLQRREVDVIYYGTNDTLLKDILPIARKVNEVGKQFYLVLPHIFRKETYERYLSNIEILRDPLIQGYVIKNLEEYTFVTEVVEHQRFQKEIILDYNIHTMNNSAKEFWIEKAVNHFTSSIELNYKELKELGCEDSDLIVYGHLPLMVSAQCVLKNTKGCIKVKNKIQSIDDIEKTDELIALSNEVELVDRKNKSFFAMNVCNYCYNLIYNGQPISLLSNKSEIDRLTPYSIRLDFTFETRKQVKDTLDEFIRVFAYNHPMEDDVKDYTRGHFKRGIE